MVRDEFYSGFLNSMIAKSGGLPSLSWPILHGLHGWYEKSWLHSIGFQYVPSRRTRSYAAVFKLSNSLSVDYPKSHNRAIVDKNSIVGWNGLFARSDLGLVN